ncbi:hypothetical protein [Herbidospora sp. NBRC 101105]|uniref:hypothetical protein n=1 Tax=Herbidospora sp. NBRC 101105 TaxID=3032195 RepID=UPI0024A07842|nr:hypothetical protein [Herbidospora sp. NBRC 101105]GLX98699.1 hypothetical protein Hesp01_66490 [Herbidospora sp. NBRC 101105]
MNPREAYRDLAEDARDYGDPDRAIDTAGRRRAARWSAVAVAAVVIAVFAWFRPQPEPAPVIHKPPHASARAHSLYSACRTGCATMLRLTDGRDIEIGIDTIYPPGNYTISPDGRWLGVPDKRGYLLSDLLGGPDLRLPAEPSGVYGPWVWAADSSRIILANHRDGDVFHYLDVDLRTGQVTRPVVPEGNEIVGLTSGGDLILQPPQKVTDKLTLTVGGRPVVFRTKTGPLADDDHGLSIQSRGDQLYLLEYGEEPVIQMFSPDGRADAYLRIPDGRYAVGPTANGYVVVEPGDRTQRLYEIGGEERLVGEYPRDAGVVIPGLARH